MARKSKGTKRKVKAELSPRDFRFPGESTVYWTAVSSIFILFIWIIAMFIWMKPQVSGLPDWRYLYVLAWPTGSIFLANFLSARPRQAQLKQAGRSARVMSNTNPELFSALLHQAQLLGMKKPPELYIIPDDAAYIFCIPGNPGAIVAGKPLQTALTQDQFMALVGREVGALASHSVRVSLAITWLQNTNPLIKVLLFPLLLMSIFMRGWLDLVEMSSDRAAVLISSEATLNLALLKLAIARDPQSDISQEDLEAFLHGSTDISTDAKQLERHFRIGSFIENQPNLRERIEQIREFKTTAQGKKALEKLAELRQTAR